jgi:hypothetical protein
VPNDTARAKGKISPVRSVPIPHFGGFRYIGGMVSPEPKSRWYHPTPVHLLVVLLAVEGTLLLSNWFHWIPREWSLLIGMASIGVAILILFVWFILALLFHWRFQFSLRSLLISVTLVAFVCSCFGTMLQKAEQQQHSAKCITELGGYIEYDYDYNYRQEHMFDDNGMYNPPPPPGSDSLREILGDDLFNGLASFSIASVDFQRYSTSEKGRIVRSYVTDENLSILRNLTELRSIELPFQPITDSGVARLKDLKRLEYVNLYGTKITDKSIQSLTELPNLKRLSVGQTQITPVALTRLIGRTHLNCLELSSDQIESIGGWKEIHKLFSEIQIVLLTMTEEGYISSETR